MSWLVLCCGENGTQTQKEPVDGQNSGFGTKGHKTISLAEFHAQGKVDKANIAPALHSPPAASSSACASTTSYACAASSASAPKTLSLHSPPDLSSSACASTTSYSCADSSASVPKSLSKPKFFAESFERNYDDARRHCNIWRDKADSERQKATVLHACRQKFAQGSKDWKDISTEMHAHNQRALGYNATAAETVFDYLNGRKSVSELADEIIDGDQHVQIDLHFLTKNECRTYMARLLTACAQHRRYVTRYVYFIPGAGKHTKVKPPGEDEESPGPLEIAVVKILKHLKMKYERCEAGKLLAQFIWSPALESLIGTISDVDV